MRLLFVAPDLGSTGGVQASARAALGALESMTPDGSLDVVAHSSTRVGMMRALFRQQPADLVLFWHAGLLKLLPFVRRKATARVALFLHGIEAWRVLPLTTNVMLRRVDRILCNSNYTHVRASESNWRIREVPATIVPLGLGEPVPFEAPDGSSPMACIIGRMDRGENYKGHSQLIAAWPDVRRAIPRARLSVIGTGDLLPELQHAASGIEGVDFAGAVDEARKSEILARSRALLMPSRNEGFGLVYLEAMRRARPCLVSDSDAGREVVNPPECGLAVNPDDKAALAGATIDLLSDGARWTQWSDNAKKRFDSQYTETHFRNRLVDALQAVMT